MRSVVSSLCFVSAAIALVNGRYLLVEIEKTEDLRQHGQLTNSRSQKTWNCATEPDFYVLAEKEGVLSCVKDKHENKLKGNHAIFDDTKQGVLQITKIQDGLCKKPIAQSCEFLGLLDRLLFRYEDKNVIEINDPYTFDVDVPYRCDELLMTASGLGFIKVFMNMVPGLPRKKECLEQKPISTKDDLYKRTCNEYVRQECGSGPITISKI